MQKKKKDLPISILKSLEKFVPLKGEKFEVVEPNNFLLSVVENANVPSFYFNIEQYKSESGNYNFLMSRKPKDQNIQGEYRTWIAIGLLESQFETWLKLIEEYDTTHSFYDDPIVKAFSDEYYADFEIIDEDAKIVPFNTKQILILDEYFDNVDKTIDNYKSEENSKVIEDIKEDISILRKNLTSKSKSFIVRSISNIWGKLTKLGTQFITEFTVETKRELLKRSVNQAINLVLEASVRMLSE